MYTCSYRQVVLDCDPQCSVCGCMVCIFSLDDDALRSNKFTKSMAHRMFHDSHEQLLT